MDILITCFLTGVSHPCLERHGQKAKGTFPLSNVLGLSQTSNSTKRFSWKWLCRHTFWRSRNASSLNHVQNILCSQLPEFTFIKTFADIFSFCTHTKGQALLLTKKSSFLLHSERPPMIYLFHYTKRQRLWFWFSTNEWFPQWPAYPIASAVILIFSKTLIFPMWTFLVS
jgi:hypothetical protein